MNTIERVGTQAGAVCVGAFATMFGDPSGGTVLATGVAGLAAIGLAFQKSSAVRACDAAAARAVAAVKASSDFRSADIERAEILLKDAQNVAKITASELVAVARDASDHTLGDDVARLVQLSLIHI